MVSVRSILLGVCTRHPLIIAVSAGFHILKAETISLSLITFISDTKPKSRLLTLVLVKQHALNIQANKHLVSPFS